MNAEDLDLHINEQESGLFQALSPKGYALYLDSEDEAYALQRHWRALHGLDPMTGEFSAA